MDLDKICSNAEAFIANAGRTIGEAEAVDADEPKDEVYDSMARKLEALGDTAAAHLQGSKSARKKFEAILAT